VYPRFLLAQAAPDELEIVRQARRVNDSMAAYAVGLLQTHLGDLDGRSVLILGLAYRAGVKEASFSSALLLIDALRPTGARILLHDPLFSAEELAATGAEPIALDAARHVDAVVLQTDQPEYQTIDWSRFTTCRVVVDGRNALDSAAIERAGMAYVGVGRFSRIAK
jgi:UDP-N-acetyl-D-mannosaminuronate dehydrogenase